MPITWHHFNAPAIARERKPWPPQPRGQLRVPFRGPGHYHFGVDHCPHDHRLGTDFTAAPRVTAVGVNGRPLAQVSVHRDTYGDRNVCVWEVRNGAGTGYFDV